MKQECRNPSAVTWSMAKLVRDRPGEARMEYLKHAVDAEAAAAFEQLGVEQQELVLSQVDFSRCRNVSAFIWSRVKALNGHSAGGMGAVGVHPRTALASTPLTRAVLPGGGGGKPGGQDRSRIRSRSPAALTGGWAGAPGALPQAVTQEDPVIAAFVQQARLDGGALEALMNLGPEEQHIVAGLVMKQECRNPSAVTWSMAKLMRDRPSEAKMEYLKHAVDAEAAAALERLGAEQQELVLSQVDAGFDTADESSPSRGWRWQAGRPGPQPDP